VFFSFWYLPITLVFLPRSAGRRLLSYAVGFFSLRFDDAFCATPPLNTSRVTPLFSSLNPPFSAKWPRRSSTRPILNFFLFSIDYFLFLTLCWMFKEVAPTSSSTALGLMVPRAASHFTQAPPPRYEGGANSFVGLVRCMSFLELATSRKAFNKTPLPF